MARPLRIEYPGALYHVISRGDRREAIYEDVVDRRLFLDLLGQVVEDFKWLCSSYCLMTNHYHLVIQTLEPNLSRGMRQLNGVFTQATNRRHDRVGHLFQGRYKAILVDRDAYFLELSRYVVLNPVRANLVEHPAAWPWSSYRGTLDGRMAPVWLAAHCLLEDFSTDVEAAVRRYERFIAEGLNQNTLNTRLNRQIFLGDDSFISDLLTPTAGSPLDPNIPRVQQRSPAQPLDYFSTTFLCRNEGIIAAYRTGEFSYHQIAKHYGVHFTTVGRIVRAAKGNMA